MDANTTWSLAKLENMCRKDLQVLAKEFGIKANLKVHIKSTTVLFSIYSLLATSKKEHGYH